MWSICGAAVALFLAAFTFGDASVFLAAVFLAALTAGEAADFLVVFGFWFASIWIGVEVFLMVWKTCDVPNEG